MQALFQITDVKSLSKPDDGGHMMPIYSQSDEISAANEELDSGTDFVTKCTLTN